jgi:hypothetical protein
MFYISGYRPPIEVNPIGIVQEFHQFHSVQNSAVFVFIHKDTYELVEHSESANTADIAILFNSYLEF